MSSLLSIAILQRISALACNAVASASARDRTFPGGNFLIATNAARVRASRSMSSRTDMAGERVCIGISLPPAHSPGVYRTTQNVFPQWTKDVLRSRDEYFLYYNFSWQRVFFCADQARRWTQ
jgi:hypothetical protein